MPKAFIIAPFTEKTSSSDDGYGPINDMSYRNFLETLEATIIECGMQATLLHKEPFNWGEGNFTPEDVIQSVYQNLQTSDVLVAYPEKSSGVNIVIGWASMMKKKVIILVNERDHISIAYNGLDNMTERRIVRFRDITDLKTKLKDTLNDFVPHH